MPFAADALLVIEVAESSLAYDRDTKVPRFARAGVAEVWLIDVAGETLVRYRHPDGDRCRDRDAPDLSSPVPLAALDDVEIDLDGLFAVRVGRSDALRRRSCRHHRDPRLPESCRSIPPLRYPE